jgi:hypothetical protein
VCLDGPLGYVQIASDFRIVTSLQQQINDLLLPGPHLAELVFHALHLSVRSGHPVVFTNQVPDTSRFGSLGSPKCMHAANLHITVN